MPTPDPHTALQNLRARAERRRLSAAALPGEASPEVERLVQELQVHQIELEMQYESYWWPRPMPKPAVPSTLTSTTLRRWATAPWTPMARCAS